MISEGLDSVRASQQVGDKTIAKEQEVVGGETGSQKRRNDYTNGAFVS